MLRALSNKFSNEGFSVSEAANGAIGLTRALEERPDIILLDILMPTMDGLTMLKQLRSKNEYGKDVPVIILTNLNSDKEGVNVTITETNPAFYLVKTSWSIQDVVEKVRERLSGV